MNKPAFLDADGADIRAWLESATTVKFLEWILWEGSRAKDDIAKNVMAGRMENAKIISGRLMALDEIMRRCEAPEPLSEVDEDEPYNPNARPKPSETARAEVTEA